MLLFLILTFFFAFLPKGVCFTPGARAVPEAVALLWGSLHAALGPVRIDRSPAAYHTSRHKVLTLQFRDPSLKCTDPQLSDGIAFTAVFKRYINKPDKPTRGTFSLHLDVRLRRRLLVYQVAAPVNTRHISSHIPSEVKAYIE